MFYVLENCFRNYRFVPGDKTVVLGILQILTWLFLSFSFQAGYSSSYCRILIYKWTFWKTSTVFLLWTNRVNLDDLDFSLPKPYFFPGKRRRSASAVGGNGWNRGRKITTLVITYRLRAYKPKLLLHHLIRAPRWGRGGVSHHIINHLYNPLVVVVWRSCVFLLLTSLPSYRNSSWNNLNIYCFAFEGFFWNIWINLHLLSLIEFLRVSSRVVLRILRFCRTYVRQVLRGLRFIPRQRHHHHQPLRYAADDLVGVAIIPHDRDVV